MSKYEMLNDCKIDTANIEESKLSSDQKNDIYNRVKSRVVFKRKTPKNRKKIFAAIALIAVACIGIFVVTNYMNIVKNPDAIINSFEYSTISITPTKQMAKGVAADTQFVITTQQDTSIQEIKKNISISPKREYKIDEVKANEYILTTSSAFNKDEVINIVVQDEQGRICKSWAFQTEGVFRIIDSYPADKQDYVEENTGVEITFSEADISEEEFKANVVIEPSIEYTLQKYNSTFVIVPTKLKMGEVYKILVKGELKNKVGQQLGDNYKFEFKTQLLSKDSYFNFGIKGTHTYTTNDIPVLTIMSSQHENDKYTATLYKFNTLEEYQDMVLSSSDTTWDKKTPDLSKLPVVQSFEIEKYFVEDYATGKLALPNKLDKGLYVLAAYAKDSDQIIDYKIIQITDLSVYVTSDHNSILVWVNDSQTGKSVENGEVNIEVNQKTYTLNTDSEGKAIFTEISLDPEDTASIMVTTSDNKIFSDLLTNNTSYSEYGYLEYQYGLGLETPGKASAKQDYYTYLYTDRAYYMPSDTVKVWGVLRPRSVDKVIPTKLELTIQTAYSSSEISLYTVPIELSKTGVFTAEIPYEKLKSNTYRICLTSEKGDIDNRYINIEEYKKPIYIMDAKSDKELYTEGEGVQVKIDANVNLYDGNPASGIPLELYSYYDSDSDFNQTIKNPNMVTNERGFVQYLIDFDTDDFCDWAPKSVSYGVTSNFVGLETLSTYNQFWVAFRDVMLTSTKKEVDDKVTIDINTNLIDYSNVKTMADYYSEDGDGTANIKGNPYDTTIIAKVKLQRYEKISLGLVYDAVYNETVEKFEYNYVVDDLGNFDITTENGKATFDALPPFKENDQSYSVVYYYSDSKGRQTKSSQHYQNDNSNEYHNYEYGTKYEFNQKEYEFDSSKNATVQLLNRRSDSKEVVGTLLHYTVNKNINNISVTSSKNIEIEYREELLPNYSISGAFFDGEHVYRVEEAYFRFDSKERQLEVEIQSNKEKYAPSEKANVTIKVTDGQNKPVGNAEVCISMVDEAIFALAQNDYDILNGLYKSVYYQNFFEFISYIPNDAAIPWGAEGGGGGDDSAMLRSDFKDTAGFERVTTDKDGYATIELKLPDDITSWRITALAISENLNAGSTKKNIIVTRDLYLTPIVNSQYLKGDDIGVTLRVEGEKVKAGEAIEYEIKISDGNDINDITKKVKSKIGVTEVVTLGKLPVGEYSITLVAKTKEYKDGLLKEFSVVESGTNALIYKEFHLKDGLQVNAKLYPVQLTFYNSQYSQFQTVLNRLSWTREVRKDEKVASVFVKYYLEQMDSEFIWYGREYTIDDIVSWDGGVGELKDSYSSPELTARLCAAYPELFKASGTKEYLIDVLYNQESTQEQVAAAYMGLAALKQPVLYDIKYLLEEEKLSELSRLYLIAALSLIGDTDTANTYYLSEIKPKISIDTKKEMATYNVEGSSDDNLYYTAIASITTSIINTNDNDNMVSSILVNASNRDLFLAEYMVYVKYFRPETEGASKFEYTLNGKVVKKTLDKIGYESINVSKEQFEKLKVTPISGNVDVTARYIGSSTELKERESDIKVEKTVTKVNATQYKVEIKATLPKKEINSTYVIDDYIPSGARFVSFTNDGNTSNVYLEDQEMQRVRFVNYNEYGSKIISFNYTIRIIVPGEYVLEGTVVNSGESNSWGISEHGKVMLGE